MFRFTQEPSSRSQSQCLAKITGMVPMCLSVSKVHSVMAAYTLVPFHTDKHSETIPVILARHRIWLPDDGSCVNRNMSEQLLYF